MNAFLDEGNLALGSRCAELRADDGTDSDEARAQNRTDRTAEGSRGDERGDEKSRCCAEPRRSSAVRCDPASPPCNDAGQSSQQQSPHDASGEQARSAECVSQDGAEHATDAAERAGGHKEEGETHGFMLRRTSCAVNRLGSDPKMRFGVRPQLAVWGLTPGDGLGSDPNHRFGVSPQSRSWGSDPKENTHHSNTNRVGMMRYDSDPNFAYQLHATERAVTPGVMFPNPVPSTFTVKSPRTPFLLPSNATFFPSGDQLG